MKADIERFTRGEPIAVEVAEIERALGSLWQQASRASDTVAVSRAALWNVIIAARGRAALAATKHLIDELAPALPTRTIVLCLEAVPDRVGERGVPPREPVAGGVGPSQGPTSDVLEATIESNVVSQPGGTRMVYSEEITIAGPAGAERHFGALVRALQVAGVPTAVFWVDPGVPESLLTRELLSVTDRLVFDTTACLQPRQLFDVARLATSAQPLPVSDLGWLRLGALRALFAGVFDPPVGGAPLVHARRITIEHRAGADAIALLLLAWIGVLLGWRPLRSAQTSDGGLRFDFIRAGQPVSGHLVPADGPCGRSGILGVELEAAAGPGPAIDRYAIRRTALDQALLQTPGVPPRPVKLDSPSDAELAVAALGARGRDPLFARCLAYAQQLWSLEPHTAGSRR